MNPRRRVLLIAIASWGIIGLRSRSANPVTGAIGVARIARGALGGVSRVLVSVTKTPLKLTGKTIFVVFRGAARLLWRRKK